MIYQSDTPKEDGKLSRKEMNKTKTDEKERRLKNCIEANLRLINKGKDLEKENKDLKGQPYLPKPRDREMEELQQTIKDLKKEIDNLQMLLSMTSDTCEQQVDELMLKDDEIKKQKIYINNLFKNFYNIHKENKSLKKKNEKQKENTISYVFNYFRTDNFEFRYLTPNAVRRFREIEEEIKTQQEKK